MGRFQHQPFRPTPNNKHVLVVQDNFSCFPAAKIVPSTAAKPVLHALEDIYTTYGNPDSHHSDNGPPFNSGAFQDFSNHRGIQHEKVFPYHPQGNPCETFMKPLDKALKAAQFTHTNQQQALDQLLIGYHSTPHPATGIAPGDVLLHGRYKTDFPYHVLTDPQVHDAWIKDIAQKDTQTAKINSSPCCKGFQVRIGDKVLLKNEKGLSKFDPIYEPTPYTINSLDGKGVHVTHPDGTIHCRHKDDIKLFRPEVPNAPNR